MNLIAISSKINSKLPESWRQSCGPAEFLVVDCDQSANKFEDVARCGLALEKHLVVDGKTLLWSDNPKYLTAGILWDLDFARNFPTALNAWSAPRGDEIVFNNLQMHSIRGWALGNPRSIIKWAACSLHLIDIDYPLFPQSSVDLTHNTNSSSRFVWIAYRIGLKVYGYQ